MGAGGFGVSLSCRSRSGCLFVSRQPDQGRRPGLQQRGQLHVTANPTYYQVTDCQATIRSHHCTSTQHKAHRWRRSDFVQQLHHCLNVSLNLIKADVHFAHSDGGTFWRFYWLEVLIWQISSLLWQNDTFKTFFLTPAGVICNQWCSILYCIFFSLTA